MPLTLVHDGERTLSRAPVLEDGGLGPAEVICEMQGGGEHGPAP